MNKIRSGNEVFCSVDIESDGPIPGPYSMLSLGAAAFKYGTGTQVLSTFSTNFNILPGTSGHPDTMKWWETQKDAWEAHRKDTVDPFVGMTNFVNWVNSLDGKPVFIGYPATFDFGFVYWYLINFVGESPFSFSALDVKSFAMCHLKTDFRNTTKRNMPKKWFDNNKKHNHVAVDDAVEQGILFMNMLLDSRHA